MNRRAFALVPALWIVVVLGALVLLHAERNSIATRAAQNRILLRVAEWARHACLAKLRERLVFIRNDSTLEHEARAHRVMTALSSERHAVGDMATCETSAVDQGTQINVNTADTTLLRCILPPPVTLKALVERRPFPNRAAIILALASVANDTETGLLAVRGSNTFNINSAPLELLRCLPEIPEEGLLQIQSARAHRRLFASIAEFAEALPSASRAVVMMSRRLAVRPPSLSLVIRGFAGEPKVISSLALTVALRGTDIDILFAEEE